MKKWLILYSIICFISSCSFFEIHRQTIEQGNILQPEEIRALHLGMSRAQVVALLGNPVLVNVFHDDTLAYIYTLEPASGTKVEKQVILIFAQQKLSKININ